MFLELQEYNPETNVLFHKDIRFHPKLSPSEKIFFIEVQSMTNKKNLPFSSRKLGKHFNVSHQTIINWVKKLVELDLLEVGINYKNQECRHYLKSKIRS